MLQPARCRKLIRTQPISYLPVGDDTRPPWQFYDGIASRARGLAPWNPKSSTNFLGCGRQATFSSSASEMTYPSMWFPTSSGGTMRRSMRPTCWIINRGSSALAEELLCRLHGLRAEIVVPDAGKAHEAFGGVDQAVEALGQRHRHDIVAVAVQHQHRCRDLADAQIRTEDRKS